MKITLASRNPGKLEEFSTVLRPFEWEIDTVDQYSSMEVHETGLTFIENAILKARFAAEASGQPSLADDSGIEVDALKGAPGIYSARYSQKGDQENNKRLLRELHGLPLAQRTARYRCVLAFMRHASDPSPIIAEGTWQGFIHTKEQGSNGFGYDSIFWLPEQGKTAAELSIETKNRLSHRRLAIQNLILQLKSLSFS